MDPLKITDTASGDDSYNMGNALTRVVMKRLGWLTGLLGGVLALALMLGWSGRLDGPDTTLFAQESVFAQDSVDESVQEVDTSPFEVALMGDMPYSPEDILEFLELQEQMNRTDAAFAIHVGDIKGSAESCADEVILARKVLFEQFEMPFVLVPGDNEWTDCHRQGAGNFDPLERLEFLREQFMAGDRSLAVPTLVLERQSNNPQFSDYRENVRWTYHNVLFTTMHVVGSGNNFQQNQAEYEARMAANLSWLAESFEMARSQELAGVMVLIHANPMFEQIPNSTLRQGFDGFIAALNAEVSNYELPVVLVHGDTHQFQRNNPLLLAVNDPDFDPAQLGGWHHCGSRDRRVDCQ